MKTTQTQIALPDSSEQLPPLPPLLSHPHFVTAYGPKNRSRIVCLDDLTRQEFKDECDINKILANYAQTGQLGHLNTRPPMWGDVGPQDFQTALHLVMDAQAEFDKLPAKVRDRFANDPAKLLAFVQDESNRSEAISLGLVPSPPPAAPATPPAPSTPAPAA